MAAPRVPHCLRSVSVLNHRRSSTSAENGGGHFAALNKRFTCHARAMTQSRGLHFQVCLQDATLIRCGGRAKGGGQSLPGALI